MNDRNQRFVQTKQVDESGAWYGLDNAGVIMPAVTDQVATSLFRFEFTLTEEVDAELLNRALADTSNRFPYFNVVLKRGMFWYYLDQCRASPQVAEDETSPCQRYDINRPGTRLFRVRLSGRRIAGEFSHALTDGSGGISFMKTLLARYFALRGVDPCAALGEGEYADILPIDGIPDRDEHEDGYQKHFPGRLPLPEPNPRAWHLRSPRLPDGQYRVITATLKLNEAILEAKKRNITLTELFGAAYLEALQSLWLAEPRRPREHFISLEIPVNLRQFFKTKSNRNFSLFILLRENMQLGARSFDELAKRAHYQMRLENDPRSLARQLARNAGGTRNLFVRMVPLFLKDVAARILFAKLGETMLSGFISNLGAFKLPPGIAPYVASVTFIPAPSPTTLTNASMLSWNNDLVVTFGSLTRSRELERLFFRRLRSLGLSVSVRCRDSEE
ncbi:hypothetical protein LWX53_02165 [bacterium]|nr:hypothetical protein [bacterium]